MTFAHEIGHNLGAEHDEDAGCRSGYVMSAGGSSKKSHMDQEFSNCSIQAIHKQLNFIMNRALIRPRRDCFKNILQKEDDQDFSICGDYKVEGNFDNL